MKKHSIIPSITLSAIAFLSFMGIAAETEPATRVMTVKEKRTVNIKIDIDGIVTTATLDSTETVRDFVSLLPITLALKDYAGTEKVADLPKKLSIIGAPPGITPATGDLTYYAPWGNIAIFHKNFSYSTGLIRLGKIDSGMEVFRREGNMKATISLLSE